MKRIASIDLLRGIVMILMALDHTRDYFHDYTFHFSPTDLTHTTPAIFFTRWITHYCAPVFVFLTGLSAYLSGQNKTKADHAMFLFKRGLWLLFAEFTFLAFFEFFDFGFSQHFFQVLSVIGAGYLFMALLVFTPRWFILFFGLSQLLLHNLLDTVTINNNFSLEVLWSLIHELRYFPLSKTQAILINYPLIPWVGLLALGYYMGPIYSSTFPSEKRQRILLRLGIVAIADFIVVRFLNVYGDPSMWRSQDSMVYTLLSFLNTTKYPPSLLYLFLLMTLGPALMLLSVAENAKGKLTKVITRFGSVPFFYYSLHLLVIHLLQLIYLLASGYSAEYTVLKYEDPAPAVDPTMAHYFALPGVYVVWIVVLLIMYPCCGWYARFKASHNYWWLPYV